MTCYKPLWRVEDLSEWKKANDGHLYHPAIIMGGEKGDLKRRAGGFETGYSRWTPIPCGQCIGCRLDYSREWANRGYLESLESDHNYFITLTYNNEHLPHREEYTTEEGITYTEHQDIEWFGNTLQKEDLTAFMKSLRQIMKRKKIQSEGIRFMACGEYGEKTRRPHYHIILFNCKLPLESFYNARIIQNETYWQNHIIEEAWSQKNKKTGKMESIGISNISECTWNTIAYVSRYITKKMKGKHAKDFYEMQGEEGEFFRASNQPGIGGNYYQKHKEEIYERDYILIKNNKGVHRVKPPKYFDKLYEKENPQLMELIKLKRRLNLEEKNLIKDTLTSLSREEQLHIEETSKEACASTLKRDLERNMQNG